MKTLLIGDLHLKSQLILPIVDKIIQTHNIKRIFFLGDYVDLHGQTNNIQLYAKDLTFLYDWKIEKELNSIEVINLMGNHDVYYLLGEQVPFSIQNLEVFFSVQQLLQDLNLQVAYQLDDYLVSHAGFNLLFDPKEWHFKPFTEEYEEELEILANAVGYMRGGGDMAGSPLWAHFRELELIPNHNYPKQIVGHTPKESIDISKNVIGIDTFSLYIDKDNKYQFIGNGDLLVYDQGHLEIFSTDWATDQTLKQLPKPQI
ncbi:serine/threonine metallophosphatase [Streptococcus pneumoniae]|uniref:metallophosphoesterase n=1 Tax=Streptococcus pneumoniae TaxID=1313 RepID=UPI0005E3BA2F|nr:metallophosphoesterase [Streptococcus pneumoniae]CKI39857.1 serine/threonine metallophosphatase [Streptococcus pneumoniae]VKI80130.1 serine/threonine metallophosphatase [Streptococcus pneumoniae]VND48751.1 serine/threonine metallophosphatase [Streptococcus pneumoniae]VPI68041.1 serine/threonine metallophosphatase [Streptococcus pneumoniae]VQX78515.1 serine/threonine metallophosphatase [Streptococcus pneumoniae]